MKIKCVETEEYLFCKKVVKTGNHRKTNYPTLTKGKEYMVYGMVIFKEELHYLTYDDYDMASWYRGTLFEVIDSRLPSNWHFRFWGDIEDNIAALWGYKDLLRDTHYDGIIELEADELAIFLKNKRIIDVEFAEIDTL